MQWNSGLCVLQFHGKENLEHSPLRFSHGKGASSGAVGGIYEIRVSPGYLEFAEAFASVVWEMDRVAALLFLTRLLPLSHCAC